MTDEHGFLDSHSPYEGEICTADPWPLPPVKPLDGSFDQPQRSFMQRLPELFHAIFSPAA